MSYNTSSPVGYSYHADYYCAECGNDLPEIDPENNEKHPVYSWSVGDLVDIWDGRKVYATCGKCDKSADKWVSV